MAARSTKTNTAAKKARQRKALTPDRVLQLGLGFWGSKTLLSAVELGVFTVLAREPLDGEALAKRLNLHPRSARDFLDALVALGLLERKNGRYRSTPETELFLDRSKASYVGGILEMSNVRLYRIWGGLTEALRTGQPQSEVEAGGNFFETLYHDPARLSGFLQAMTGLSIGAGIAIAGKFPWKKYKTFVDIGTAQGAIPVQIALRNKHLSGVGFDLPVVRPFFEQYVAEAGLASRLRFEAGNFLRDPLPQADVLIMGHILHGEGLENKRMLIAKAYEALPHGGSFLIFEELIDDERRQNAFALLMSLNILVETPEGFNTTGAEYARWLREAGFHKTLVEYLAGPVSMLVGVKP
jgi:hypothetical protein